ncbi:hypothetical protein J2Z22_003583 [Paenibacillus forsythiae]|uniref:GNAT family N-acetyltransferase n=1 Tax=Paenibacillus forsythiae TaxID=365616 RepID=A0ABU3HAY8_9BACL|nr:hypothetical protein [Paenibacillus forsythiae]MDT3427993.1 hypothetical protein [Paenibacillus forsythiae]
MKIRPYVSGDLEGVERLFIEREVLLDRELFLWKKKAPSIFSWVGEKNEAIVAHYSIIEMPLIQDIRTGFAVDAIFTKHASQIPDIAMMLSHALQEVQLAGLDLIVGIPNQRMSPVKRMLGWTPMPVYYWNISKGRERISKPFVCCETAFSDYERWRYKECPRQYTQQRDCGIVLSGEREYAGTPYLMRYDCSNWNDIEQTYAFSYLHTNLSGNLPVVQPLYMLLTEKREQASLIWPDIWPLETLEGVTLGW